MIQHDIHLVSDESIAAPRRELVIIGAGGFGAIVASVARDINANVANELPAPWDIVGYADADAAKRGTRHEGYPVHGTLEDAARDFRGRELWFFCAIGENNARANVARSAEELGWKPATLIHPTAIVASNVEVGAGSYIGPLSVTSVNAKIGAHATIDMHASIGHDAVLKDFCAVYPGARISGCSRLGEYVLVGSNATLLPGTVVGDRAVVGASSLANGSIEPDTTVLGVPARIIYRKSSAVGREFLLNSQNCIVRGSLAPGKECLPAGLGNDSKMMAEPSVRGNL